MATVTPVCLIKSVILQEGESFILPPNATLVGASDTNAFTSTCDIPTLETLGCFVALIASRAYNRGGPLEYYEPYGMRMNGFELNGVYKAFDGGYIENTGLRGTFEVATVIDKLKAEIPAILYADGEIFAPASNNESSRTAILIQTIPSIAKNLLLRLRAVANVSPGGGPSDVIFTVRFVPLADATATGLLGLPACPGNNTPPQT